MVYVAVMERQNFYWFLLAAGAGGAVFFPPLAIAAGVRHPAGAVTAAFLPLAFYLAGALAFVKRPAHAAAQRLLAVGALHLLSVMFGALTILLLQARFAGAWMPNLLSSMCFSIGFAAFVALYAVFPDGRYWHPRERTAVRGAILLALVLPLLSVLGGPNQQVVVVLTASVPRVAGPLWIHALSPLANLYPIIFFAPLAGLGLLISHYRRGSLRQRLQMRWPLASAVLLGAALLASPLMSSLIPGWLETTLFLAAATTLPVSLVIGMVRHQLFDVDLFIRQSVIYGILWLAIALMYATISTLLGLAAGQHISVQLAVLVTIAAGMAFQPARQALERLADRIVFGERRSGYDLIRTFGATLENTFALDDLVPAVASTVRQGLDARWTRVSLYATHDHSLVREVRDGIKADEIPGADLVAPLTYNGEHVGIIECGPKREGTYAPADRDLLTTLGRQAALAIRNARLAAELVDHLNELARHARELATSRTRLVQAQEVERRRIERDIHDGVQQEIVALMAKVDVARALLQSHPERVEPMLVEIQDIIHQTHTDLRELVRGIHPSVLGDHGLEEAIVSRVAHLPLGVTIKIDPNVKGQRYASKIEGAAYFLVSEGLTNVMKHAAVGEATVSLQAMNGSLHVEIEDLGRGFDPDCVSQSGLEGLLDRMEALGGRLDVEAAPGHGSRLLGVLPAREPERV